MKVLLLYAHPSHQHSRTNRIMFEKARAIEGITAVDLYAAYPRHDIDIDREQQQLVDHDVIVFQFPLFWYSTPSIIKEWQDLVLEHGFAYGEHGHSLDGKHLLCAISAGGPEQAYTATGRNRFTLRQLLSPMEATANLCRMHFLAPYVLYGTLETHDEARRAHVAGYVNLIEALRDDRLDCKALQGTDILSVVRLGDFMKERNNG